MSRTSRIEITIETLQVTRIRRASDLIASESTEVVPMPVAAELADEIRKLTATPEPPTEEAA